MVESLFRSDRTASLMGEKTTELALRISAEKTAKEQLLCPMQHLRLSSNSCA